MNDTERAERNAINEERGIGKVRGISKGRPPKHPGLTALATKLGDLRFANPLTQDEMDLVKAGVGQSHKGITILPYAAGPLWTARASFLGAPVIIGMAYCKSLEHAVKMLRYADMCRLKFWPYRMRQRRPPQPGELNISLARAELDLKNETAIVALLDEIENYMLNNGIVKTVAQVTEEIKAVQKNRVQQTRQCLRDINSRIGELTTRLNTAITTFDTRMDGLTGMVQSLQADNKSLLLALGSVLNQLNNQPRYYVGTWSGAKEPVVCCTEQANVVVSESESDKLKFKI